MVLAEAFSIIIRTEAIHKNFKGGYSAFKGIIPIETHCSDGELTRVGFMSYETMINYAEFLIEYGLNSSKDFILFDMVQGPLISAPWIEWLRYELFPDRSENKYTVAWLKPEYGGVENPMIKKTAIMVYPNWWIPEKAIQAEDFIGRYEKNRYKVVNNDFHVLTLYDTVLNRIVYSV